MDRHDQAFDMRPYSRLACQSDCSGQDVVVEITYESLSAWMDENPQVRRALEAEEKWPPPR